MKKWILLLVVCTVFIGKSHAGLLLEPYAGMIFNTTMEDNAGEDQAVTGMAYGARVGFQNLGLMLGLDYQMGSPSVEDSDYDYSFSNYGLFIGYDFPIMLRVWATYIMSGSFSASGDILEDGDDRTLEYTKVSGTKFGLGYKVIPFVSLNLEIQSLDYKDAELDGTAVDLDDSAGNSIYLLSVSFPFTI